MGVDGVPVAPNNIGVYLSPPDFEKFASFADALARELAEVARDHARSEGYHFVGPVTVTLVADDELRDGRVRRRRGDPRGRAVGSLVLPDGRRVPLGEATMTMGRMSDCDIVVADPRVVAEHAEIKPSGHGFVVTDLGSMNGTVVNGAPVREHPLVDGDEIRLGNTVLRFEAS